MTREPKISMDTVRAAALMLDECGRSISPAHVTAATLDVVALERCERGLRAIYCRQCNGYADTDWGRAQAERDERREARLIRQATKIAKGYGVTITTQGDPRGSALRMATPKTRRYNTMGGAESGWAL
jgi:hypothetical protein